jgi:C_GCAxxG_C_C family probable redox protein
MSEREMVGVAAELAERRFRDGYNCAQSVLEALASHFGLADQDLWQQATGLGAGFGRRQFVCGAVSGGVMACGLVAGRRQGATREDRDAFREATYRRVQELIRRFEARFGTVECRALLGCDLLTPEGQTAFRDRGLLDGVCLPAIRFVVKNASDILENAGFNGSHS